MTKFNTILFDMDGTLLDFHMTENEALTNTCIEININPTKENFTAYSEGNELLWKQLEEGKIDKDTLKVERFRMFLEKINVDFSPALASDIYLKHLSNSYFYIDYAKEICENLACSHALAIATNGIASVQHSRIKKSGLKKYFKHHFISDEIGYPKPKIEFFDFIFKKMNIKNPDEVIIVGDSLTSDIKGGNNAGIATCWYNPEGLANDTDSICSYEIKSLKQLKEIVAR